MCFGVARALKMVRKAAAAADGPITTLGPLIHNPQVVDDLARQGVSVATDPRQPQGTTLVIRAHGVGPDTLKEAQEAGVKVVDATCPYVTKVHHIAGQLSHGGYTVLVVGERGHAEVEGTIAHASGAQVVNSAQDVQALAHSGELGRKVGVVVQTTQTVEKLTEVTAELLRHCIELRIYNTICEATSKRQQAAADLAKKSDVMIVIGGRNSANTTHLAEICANFCPKTYHIEQAGELQSTWFAGADRIGITAGASTPPEQIQSVCDAIETVTAP